VLLTSAGIRLGFITTELDLILPFGGAGFSEGTCSLTFIDMLAELLKLLDCMGFN
jgi:hypothetical protein